MAKKEKTAEKDITEEVKVPAGKETKKTAVKKTTKETKKDRLTRILQDKSESICSSKW